MKGELTERASERVRVRLLIKQVQISPGIVQVKADPFINKVNEFGSHSCLSV